MTDNAQLGQATVSVTFHDGQVLELKPTIYAMQMISKLFDGLQGATQRIAALDIQCIHEVIILGAGAPHNQTKNRAAILEKIFLTGLTDDTGGLAERALTYVTLLMRGGRPAPQTVETSDGGTEGNLKLPR